MWGERMNNMVDLSWKQHYLLTRAIKKIDSSNAQRLLLHILAKRNEKEKQVILKISDVKKNIFEVDNGGNQRKDFNDLFLQEDKTLLQQVFQKSIIQISKENLKSLNMPIIDSEGKERYYDITASIIKTIFLDNEKDEMIVSLNDDLIPFLDPIDKYIWVSLEKVLKLRNKYAYKLYLYCKTKLDESSTDVIDNYKVYIYKTKTNPDENLETWLDFETKNTYSVFSKIEKRILIPAIIEINNIFKKDKELYISPEYTVHRKNKKVEYIELSFKRYKGKFSSEIMSEERKKISEKEIEYQEKELKFFNDYVKNLLQEKNDDPYDEDEGILDFLFSIRNSYETGELMYLIFNKEQTQRFIHLKNISINDKKWGFLVLRKIILNSSMKNSIQYKDVIMASKILLDTYKDTEENFRNEKKLNIEI